MASGGTGILTSDTGAMRLTAMDLEGMAPEVARRTWPRWIALGVAMLAVAVVAVLSEAAGARLLLGALGAFLVVRGVLLVRGARSAPADLAVRARGLGAVATAAGAGALVVALASGPASAGLLLVAVPVLLLLAAAALLGRGGAARRGGQALLVWALLVTGLLAGAGLAQGWSRAADVATVIAAVGVAVLAVPVLIGASGLRAVAARPDPAPARTVPAGCGGCACGAGGCGA